jgi:hypothetical protein
VAIGRADLDLDVNAATPAALAEQETRLLPLRTERLQRTIG